MSNIKKQIFKHGIFSYYTNDEYIGKSLSEYGEWSESEVVLLKQLVKDNENIIEIGSNIGTHTIVGNTDHKISVLLSEQMTIAESIVTGLRAIKDPSADLVDLADHIEEVVDAYHNLWSVKKEGENIDYLTVELAHDEVVTISDMILELREEITM